MALVDVAVNYASLFANGTLSAASVGTTWNNPERLADHFIKELAKTAGTPSGLTEIKVDQGADATKYLSADRIIIPALHNIDVALTLEYNSTDTWPGTSVTLSSGTPTSGSQFSATFTKVVAGAGNRWWRLSFTKTDAALQIPEVWLTERIVLGQSETGIGLSGRPDQPLPFPIRRNHVILTSLEGVRSAVEQGPELREMALQASNITAASLADWEGLWNGTQSGLKKFYIDDPRGVTWFAQITEDLEREIVSVDDAFELWSVRLPVVETF